MYISNSGNTSTTTNYNWYNPVTNNYDLTADEVWGTYFCYNAVNYDYVAEDDGTALGLWHLNNNLKDSSYWANSTGSLLRK